MLDSVWLESRLRITDNTSLSFLLYNLWTLFVHHCGGQWLSETYAPHRVGPSSPRDRSRCWAADTHLHSGTATNTPLGGATQNEGTSKTYFLTSHKYCTYFISLNKRRKQQFQVLACYFCAAACQSIWCNWRPHALEQRRHSHTDADSIPQYISRKSLKVCVCVHVDRNVHKLSSCWGKTRLDPALVFTCKTCKRPFEFHVACSGFSSSLKPNWFTICTHVLKKCV